MTPSAAPIRRVRTWLVGGVALALALIGILALWRPWQPPATPSTNIAAGAGEGAVQVLPDLLELPDDPTVLIFGDSWTYGSAATDPTLGYAYLMAGLTGWTTTVDGVRGSGYLKPGIDGPDYGTRIAALDTDLDPDLVIVQGSINDRRLPAAGYREAVDAAWDALAERYPSARIVILGPAPQVLPVETATDRIDRDLASLAAARGWWYISPVEEGWITTDRYAEIIDTGVGRDHPSDAGHRYLAARLSAAIEAISR